MDLINQILDSCKGKSVEEIDSIIQSHDLSGLSEEQVEELSLRLDSMV